MHGFLISLALLFMLLATSAQAAPLRLVMAYDRGCNESARWIEDIGPAYATHPEGRQAPLVPVAIEGPWPDGLIIGRRPHLSPTFILTRDGLEIGRMEGYSSPADFWTGLGLLIQRNDVKTSR
ncbi:MAG: SoxS protein [Paracoccus sp. (in: a-proteobacteria)]